MRSIHLPRLLHSKRTDDAQDLGHNAGMDAYAYSPLMHPSAFRLFRLAAGSGQDEISCMLEQRVPEDAGDYEALSYTWGDPTEKRSIKCCNKPFLVTENLFSALRHLRYADRDGSYGSMPFESIKNLFPNGTSR